MSGARVELRLGNSDVVTPCALVGMAHGRVHLLADRNFNPDTRVFVKFMKVTLEAIVEYSTPKGTKHRICVSVTAEAERRRREPRLPIHQYATITSIGEDSTTLPCILSDLSRSGLRAQLSEPLAVETMVCVETDTAIVAGEIRHCQERPGYYEIGVEITDIITDTSTLGNQPGVIESFRWKLATLIAGERLTFARKFLR